MRRFYCNCCGADWPAPPDFDEDEDIDIECPNCGAIYDEDYETCIEAYNA